MPVSAVWLTDRGSYGVLVDVRIGVSRSPRELTIEMPDNERDATKDKVETALGGDSGVLWLTDKRGRTFAVQSASIVYVELGVDDGGRRIGFGG